MDLIICFATLVGFYILFWLIRKGEKRWTKK